MMFIVNSVKHAYIGTTFGVSASEHNQELETGSANHVLRTPNSKAVEYNKSILNVHWLIECVLQVRTRYLFSAVLFWGLGNLSVT